MISPRPGLFPYISRYIRKALMTRNIVTLMDITSTVILAASSQVAIPLTPSFNIMAIGDVMGKIVRNTQRGLFGYKKSNEENQSGTKAKSV